MEKENPSNPVRDMDRRAGDLVAEMRHIHGVAQGSLAAALNVDQAAISRIERGRRRVSVGEFLACTLALGISVEDVAAMLESLRSSSSTGALTTKESDAAVGEHG